MKKLLLLIFLLIPLSAHAAGVEISPSRLHVAGQLGDEMSAEIVVSNPTADILLFDVYPDDFADSISVSPKSFTLESGERKKIQLQITAQNEGRLLTTNISVLAKPLAESRFSANTGIKIPLTITVASDTSDALPAWVFFVYLAMAMVILYLLSPYARRKKAF
ncbi:MAG: hypothetical protein A2826_02045 [Candidatus Doudnabacteria bacterium RIFCSPHIGHO2_01_FULL_43_23]|uniref:Alpha-galactosidase NEW3 domain-containing protein n=1 Tax=Candidatus Doudnabacteria bacterium RIFCSPHIGHO2_01_FULL_43_23 TaxID=1817822 RepID=A0A1F5NUG9_9BACT|nr:MAG: hypothetical protein A2826_02045 [Candidatus Doudnabacteria bacterium RIFCSPHIGHO2_01_FULL_43_23]